MSARLPRLRALLPRLRRHTPAPLPYSARPISAPTDLRQLGPHNPRRFNSTTPATTTTTALNTHPHHGEPAATEPQQERPPSYQLHFTCRPCRTRSSHEISKQAYHYGSVLIKCPSCSGRHVIADHLKIFGEQARSLEQILEEAGRGEKIKFATQAPELKGIVCDDGSVQILSSKHTEGGRAEAEAQQEVAKVEKE